MQSITQRQCFFIMQSHFPILQSRISMAQSRIPTGHKRISTKNRGIYIKNRGNYTKNRGISTKIGGRGAKYTPGGANLTPRGVQLDPPECTLLHTWWHPRNLHFLPSILSGRQHPRGGGRGGVSKNSKKVPKMTPGGAKFDKIWQKVKSGRVQISCPLPDVSPADQPSNYP